MERFNHIPGATSQSVSADPRLTSQLFAQIFHASPIAISVSTLDKGLYLEVNDSFLRQTGYSLTEVIGYTPVGIDRHGSTAIHGVTI